MVRKAEHVKQGDLGGVGVAKKSQDGRVAPPRSQSPRSSEEAP